MRTTYRAILSLLISLWIVAEGPAKELSEGEVTALKSDVDTMLAAFEAGDTKSLFDKTHESIFELMGGRESFERVTKQLVSQLMESGIKFVSSEMGDPTQLYMAGAEEVCFVPRISVIEYQGKMARSAGFMIAIRKVDGAEWKFLDGSALRKNPQLLKLLLPDLEADIELPPNTVEVM